MIWNDEQDAFIRRCWEDGLSAKLTSIKFNDEFGAALSRNAIIGRWHRTGCCGRQSKWHPKKRFKALTPKAAVGRGELGAARKTATSPARDERGRFSAMVRAINEARKEALTLPPSPPVPAPAATRPVISALVSAFEDEEASVPVKLGVSLLDLKESMCRMPIGDPQEDGFHFCGAKKAGGLPYCEKCARVAFRPVQRRRPARPVIRSNELKLPEMEVESI